MRQMRLISRIILRVALAVCQIVIAGPVNAASVADPSGTCGSRKTAALACGSSAAASAWSRFAACRLDEGGRRMRTGNR